MTLECEGGGRLLPKFNLTAPTLKQLCEPWQQCLVIQLLGKDVGFLTLRDRLPALWKVQGGLELLDVSYGYFMVKFDLEADRDRVMHGGPWMLFDHYLIVRPWSPEFVASATKVDSTPVWVRFPGLGVMFYDESVLLTIASAIGKPIKVDLNTLNMTRGRFARVCVEINLNEPVVGRFFLNGVWYNVEYEGLHLLCSSCGCYGHVLRNCHHAIRSESVANGVGEETVVQPSGDPSRSAGSGAETGENSTPHSQGGTTPDPHGDWLIVKRRNRKPNLGRSLSKGRSSSHNGTADVNAKNQDKPIYSTGGIYVAAGLSEGVTKPREVLMHTREQEHAVEVGSAAVAHVLHENPKLMHTREQKLVVGARCVMVGHIPHANPKSLGSNKETKKRNRVEELGAHSWSNLMGGVGGVMPSHIAHSAHVNSPLGDSRDGHTGMTGVSNKSWVSSVLHTRGTSNLFHEPEESGPDIPGKEDVMQYDQSLEEEAMLA
uniref:DUF4283 domain-containing protein n=1 Tax=Cajanus cajan TaxID=3821 RepID=A0A151U1V8_CAJCA|nr:hypothetical protein KK1_005823 [Cajanus cajan]